MNVKQKDIHAVDNNTSGVEGRSKSAKGDLNETSGTSWKGRREDTHVPPRIFSFNHRQTIRAPPLSNGDI